MINNTFGANAKAESKKAWQRLMMRWHPDKFNQKFGARLHENEKDKILERVKEVSQNVQALRRS